MLKNNDKKEIAQCDGDLATRLAALQQEVDQSVRDRLLPGPKPRIIGASKGQPVTILIEAARAGLADFGENRVQEMAAKAPELKAAYPNVTLHLIGPLQSNKTKEAVALFDVIQTLDRPKIADAVAAEMDKQNRSLTTLVQVNTGDEPQKGGVSLKELDSFIHYCRDKAGLKPVGLMAVPPADENPAPHFALLKKLAGDYGMSELSMGMSGDFRTAIRLGATYVRIGTRLFGPR